MKTRVMLVFPPFENSQTTVAPLGIGYLAAYVRRRNPKIMVTVVDFSVKEFTVKGMIAMLERFRPELLGISVLTLNFPGAKLIARLAKQYRPAPLVVMGGVHATMLPEECLTFCDVVVRGEGEETLWELIEEHPLNEIDGIVFKRNGRIIHNKPRRPIARLDDLPFPAHDLFEMERYYSFPTWGVMGSRGCPYNCVFCSSPAMWHRRLRVRSAKNIVDEIEVLHRRCGINKIMFYDDTINIPRSRAFQICQEIIKRGLHDCMSFACQMRANRQFVSLKLFQKMKQAGFDQVEFGIETGSQMVMDSIGKNLTVEEARRAVCLAHKAGMAVVKGFFMIGNWGEGPIDVLKTWRFILSTPVMPVFSICTPFPGTKLHTFLKKGELLNDVDWSVYNQSTVVSRTPTMSKPAIKACYLFSYVVLQLLLGFLRGRTIKQTLKGGIHILGRKMARSRKQLVTSTPEV